MGSCHIYMGYFCPFSVQSRLGVSVIKQIVKAHWPLIFFHIFIPYIRTIQGVGPNNNLPSSGRHSEGGASYNAKHP